MTSKKKKLEEYNGTSMNSMKLKSHNYSEQDLEQLSLNVHLLQLRLQLHSLTYNTTDDDNQTEKKDNINQSSTPCCCCDPFKVHYKRQEKVKLVPSNSLRKISLSDFLFFSEHNLVLPPGYRVCINCSDMLNNLSRSDGVFLFERTRIMMMVNNMVEDNLAELELRKKRKPRLKTFQVMNLDQLSRNVQLLQLRIQLHKLNYGSSADGAATTAAALAGFGTTSKVLQKRKSLFPPKGPPPDLIPQNEKLVRIGNETKTAKKVDSEIVNTLPARKKTMKSNNDFVTTSNLTKRPKRLNIRKTGEITEKMKSIRASTTKLENIKVITKNSNTTKNTKVSTMGKTMETTGPTKKSMEVTGITGKGVEKTENMGKSVEITKTVKPTKISKTLRIAESIKSPVVENTIVSACCDPFSYHAKKGKDRKSMKIDSLREISTVDSFIFTKHGYDIAPGQKVCIRCSDKLNNLELKKHRFKRSD